MRQKLGETRTWVIKIGSSLLTDDGRGLNNESISRWVEQIAALTADGVRVVLVSSGAVAEGVVRLGLSGRPSAIHEQQAAAAVGQMGLIQAWESHFMRYGLHTAQILLTHDDLSNRKRYLNARSTLNTLLGMGVVPVVNENDTVVTDEICFGDNDTLAGLVANLVNAEVLVILTDQQGLFSSDPRSDKNAELIRQADSDDPALLEMAGVSKGVLGKGGMQTKIKAARLAARSGTCTLLAHGAADQVLMKIRAGENLGTLLVPEQQPVAARKQWLGSQLKTRGAVVLDKGAVKVLRNSGKSLLPVGVRSVKGSFNRGDMVACEDEEGSLVARGLINYSADDAEKIIGRASEQILQILGYDGEPELIHRDNLVLL